MTDRFVIFCHARSGSTWLVNTLNNIDGVTCYGEMFLGDATTYQDGTTKMERFLLWRETHPGMRPFITYRYLSKLYGGGDTQGFKLMYAHLLKYGEIALYILTTRPKVVHLVRKNTLDAILSALVAKERGRFHFKDQDTVPEEKPITVDADLLVTRMSLAEQKIRLARRVLRLSGLDHIEVYYEDFLADVQNFKPIWKFLGKDFEKNPPTWQNKKGRQKNRRETISNYSEVKSRLASAGYAHFLDD